MTDSELAGFIDDWKETESGTKRAFVQIANHLDTMEHITLDFVARPGISYSLRPRHRDQEERKLFAMVDVIDDDPDDRWLSVCFYGDMITDPQQEGDLVPEGLLGEDGYCFDLYEYDSDTVAYLEQRLSQAYDSAAGSSNS